MTYAVGTSVSVEKSRAEIERILKRYGASHFAFMSSPGMPPDGESAHCGSSAPVGPAI